MRSSLRIAVATVTVAVLALGLLASPALGEDAGPPLDYTSLADTLSQPVFPDLVTESATVPMHDGVEVYVEVTRPNPEVYGEQRLPVVLEASPYHGTIATRIGDRIFPDPKGADGANLGLTGYFAPRGYAVVMMDLRGTGRSQGCLDHLGQNDAKDLKRIVEWAADQPWSNGKVGMTGHSYVGSTPIVAAAQNPRGLVTIAPSAGLASMYDHQFQKGVPYLLQWAGPQWAYELLAVSRHLPPGLPSSAPLVGPLPTGTTGDNFGNDMQYFGCGAQNSALTAGTGQVTGQYESWHGQRDWREAAAQIDIPVFMIHGVNDNAARIPAAEWFFLNRTPRETDKVWIGQWDHGGAGAASPRCNAPSGGKGHPNCRFAQWQYALHAWFDKHLQGRDVDTGPNVEMFLNGETVATDSIWSAKGLPLTMHASDTALSLVEPASAGTKTFTAAAQRASGSWVDFVSEPLEDDVLVRGMPKVRLHVATNGPVQLLANVYKKPQGGAVDLTNPITVCAIQPLLRFGVATVTPVIPGQVMELSPQCFTAAHHLEAGDQLVLRVTTPRDHVGAQSHHVPMLAADPQVTVHTGPGATSFTLPTVPDPVLHPDPLHAEL